MIEVVLSGRPQDYWKIGRRAPDSLAAVEAMLTQEAEASRLSDLVYAYGELALLQGVERTPAVVLRLAREGPLEARSAAIHILGQFGDGPAIEILASVLAREPANEDESTFLSRAIRASGESHSEILAMHLAEIVRRNAGYEEAAVEAIGNIGLGDQRELLRDLVQNSGRLHICARWALSQVEPLQEYDRDERLIELAESSRMAGTFSWYQWALRKVVHLRLTQYVGRLRALYDLKRAIMPMNSPTCFAINLLVAIHKLGGGLSAEEIDLLEGAGRLPSSQGG